MSEWRHVALILRNDLRLTFRELHTSKLRAVLIAAVLGLVLVLAHGIAFTVCWAIGAPPPLAVEAWLWWLFATFMAGIAAQQSITLLYVRTDLDLLLTAPLSPRTILFARLLAIAAFALLGVALFLAPLLNGATAFFGASYLFGYLAWLALALASAAVGLGTALTLVRLFGVRRGRLIAQVSGALLGASAYLATQLHHFLPPGAASLVARAVSALSEQPAFLLPANAARGDLVALALLGMIALVASGTIAWALGRSLLRGAQDAEVRLPRGTQRAPRRWRGSPWSVGLRKELRLIVRDPLLLAKVLPSAFYLLPAALVFGRTLGGTVFASIAVIFAGQFSSVLTRVTADGEECWDLIRLSPSDEHDQRTVKMVAGFTLPALIATTFCIVTAFFGAPGTAAIGLVCSLAVGAAAARVQVSSIRPTPRRDVMKRRKGDFNPLQLLVGFLMFLGMLGVGFFARGWHWPGLVVSSVTLIAAAMTYQLVRFKETHFPHS